MLLSSAVILHNAGLYGLVSAQTTESKEFGLQSDEPILHRLYCSVEKRRAQLPNHEQWYTILTDGPFGLLSSVHVVFGICKLFYLYYAYAIGQC